MQKISDKSKNNLYNCVANEVMDARIKINILLSKYPELKNNVDDILSNLSITAPKKAINCFHSNHDKI